MCPRSQDLSGTLIVTRFSVLDFNAPALGRLIRREFASTELHSLLEETLACKEAGNAIRCLSKDDAQSLIDVVDEACYGSSPACLAEPVLTRSFFLQALDRPGLSPSAREVCLRQLYRACGCHALLPKALKIPICYDRTKVALYRGGHADVWKGVHCGRDVAVKVLRTYSDSNLQRIVGVSFLLCLISAHLCADHATEVLQGGCDVEDPPAS